MHGLSEPALNITRRTTTYDQRRGNRLPSPPAPPIDRDVDLDVVHDGRIRIRRARAAEQARRDHHSLTGKDRPAALLKSGIAADARAKSSRSRSIAALLIASATCSGASVRATSPCELHRPMSTRPGARALTYRRNQPLTPGTLSMRSAPRDTSSLSQLIIVEHEAQPLRPAKPDDAAARCFMDADSY
jgi:hypothetical protein